MTPELRDALVRAAVQFGATTALGIVGNKYGERTEEAAKLAVDVAMLAIANRAPHGTSDEEYARVVHELKIVPVEELIARGQQMARGDG